MSEAFPQTEKTAGGHLATARLLERAARRANAWGDDQRALLELARIYTAYAEALREAVGGAAEDEPEQGALL